MSYLIPLWLMNNGLKASGKFFGFYCKKLLTKSTILGMMLSVVARDMTRIPIEYFKSYVLTFQNDDGILNKLSQ